MKVISGEKRGMRLTSPVDSKTRPTEGRVKESIFDTLFLIKPNSAALDLFAGSGAIGIEFLSRGSDLCVFSDSERTNIKCINDNLEHTKLKNRSKVYHGDFKRNLLNIENKINRKFDYIFIDPPYKYREYYHQALDLIKELDLLNKDGIIIMESKEVLDEKDFSDYNLFKEKRYGKIHVYYLNMGE